jgi:hypothetical protein
MYILNRVDDTGYPCNKSFVLKNSRDKYYHIFIQHMLLLYIFLIKCIIDWYIFVFPKASHNSFLGTLT